MRMQIKAGELDRYIWTIKVIGLAKPPFTVLRQREIEVYAYLNMVYNKYSNLGEVEANSLTFSKKVKKEICDHFGITMENFYNILVNLRRYGLIGEEELKVKIKPTDTINIVFL